LGKAAVTFAAHGLSSRLLSGRSTFIDIQGSSEGFMMRISQTWQVLRLTLWAVMLVFCTKAVHAQPASLAGCRAIEDRLARFDCYESLEVDAAETDSAAEAGLPADTGNGAAVERETAETAPEV